MISELANICDPSLASSLSLEDQQRVAVILDEYLIATEEGRQPTRDSLLARHADLAPILCDYLDGLHLLQKMAVQGVVASSENPVFSRSLAEYDLDRELGRGSMGVVYTATQRSLGRRVAIKVLSFGGALDGSRLQRFQREAHVTAALRHPGIVSVFDVGCDEGTHFYVMQLVDGHALDRHIEHARRYVRSEYGADHSTPLLSGPAHFRLAARLISEAADAMHSAHLAGIVHRDIKPSNLLVDADGKLLVTDFGLARFEAHGDLTRSGELIGTLRYMSPEQASGRGELVDGRTDIYGLGATLYELVTLQPAFLGDDCPTLLRHICESTPAAPRSINAAIPRDLQSIIEKAMHRDRAARYQTAQDLSADLHRFLDGKPILAKRRGPVDDLTAWSKKNTGILLTSLLFVSLVAAGSLLHSFMLTAEKNRTQQATLLSQENYKQAREAVDSLGTDMASRLASIPAAESVRRDILAESLSYYEQFVDLANDDPSLQFDVAETRLQIARIVRQIARFEGAVAAYSAAIEALRAVDSSSARARSSFIWAVNELAMLHSEHGDQSAALKLLGDLELQSAPPAALALTHNNRGVVWLKSGVISHAKVEIAAAIDVLKLTVSNSTGQLPASLLENLADSLCNMSVLLDHAGELNQARELALQAIELRHAVHEKSTDFRKLERLAIAHSNLGALSWKAGQGEAAMTDFQDAVQLFERASSTAPKHAQPRRELAVALNNLAMVATSLGEDLKAELALERACKIADAEFQSDPRNAESASHLAGILNNQAVLLRKMKRKAEAARLFASSLKHQSIAVELVPSSESYRQSLDQIRSSLSELTE